MARKSGLYALLSRDGSSVASADANALGLRQTNSSRAWLAEAHDTHAPDCAHSHCDDAGLTLILGEIEEVAELATSLGFAADTPVARLARAALDIHGTALPGKLIGEWSLLHIDRSGRVVLVQSAARRDPILYAQHGARLAVAPEIALLAKLAWVGNTIDAAGFYGKLGGPLVRHRADGRTLLSNVRQVLPGETVTIAADGTISRSRPDLFETVPDWRGSFADAAAESEALLLAIMRERAARSPRIAGLLSGGLDSSLLAWAVSAAAPSTSYPFFVTSVAPPGTGIADEAHEARLVANHLQREWLPVHPPDDASPYCPPDLVMRGDVGPPLSNRHELTTAFQEAAKAAGATSLLNGTYGESSFTFRSGTVPPTPLMRLRWLVRTMLRRSTRPVAPAQYSPFHVRVASHRLGQLAELTDDSGWSDPFATPDKDGRLGFRGGVLKSMWHANEFCPGALRMDFPYRDMRLLRLFAGFPLDVLAATGGDREPARTMLAGRLPDAIRLRRSGRPAYPGHFAALQRHAPAARQRIARFRAVGVDDWLDLDWLDTALSRMAAQGPAGVDFANEVQLTAMTAEYLVWWFDR